MAVTITETSRLEPIAPGVYLYKWKGKATGDVSGGTVSIVSALPGIEPTDRVVLVKLSGYQSSAGEITFILAASSTFWSGLNTSDDDDEYYVIKSSTNQGALNFQFQPNALPLFLGQKLSPGVNSTIEFRFDTNTNLAIYQLNMLAVVYKQ